MDIKKGGQVAATLNTHTEYDYKTAEEVIPFGVGVMRGTNKETQAKVYNTGGKFLGVAAERVVNTGSPLQYEKDQTVEIFKRGLIWVEIGAAVNAGDKAAVGPNGKFAPSGTGTYDDVDGVFETTASTGYAVLRLK